MEAKINKMNRRPSEEERLRLEDYLSSICRPLLFGHISPDGDSVGSTLAMYHLLRNRGKQPWVTMAGHIPNTLTWLPASDNILMVEGEEYPSELDRAFQDADAFICLDFNAPYRMGKVLEQKLRSALQQKKRPLLAIDHHEEPSQEFDFILSKPDASATCELVTELFRNRTTESSKNEITPTIATCLLTGVITDTGLFNHSSSFPEIFLTTAELLRCGANKTRIVNEIFHRYSEDRFYLESFVRFQKLHFVKDLKVAYFTLSRAEQEELKVKPGDTEGLVNIPLDVDGIEISAFFKETLYEGVKISLRSKGILVVNDIARDLFGGGGHMLAAGAEFAGTLEEAVALFLDFVQKNKYQEIEKLK